MDPAARQSLLTEWLSNEAELQRLPDLPATYVDPASRERELDERQDEIEWEVGEVWLAENKARKFSAE